MSSSTTLSFGFGDEANGNSVTYLLSECPSAAFSGDTLILKAGDVEVSYPLNPSVRFEFVESSEESTDIQNAKSEPLFKIAGNQISIFNIRPNSIANIYDLSGQALKSELSDSEGRIVMDVLNLPHGTYVINQNK